MLYSCRSSYKRFSVTFKWCLTYFLIHYNQEVRSLLCLHTYIRTYIRRHADRHTYRCKVLKQTTTIITPFINIAPNLGIIVTWYNIHTIMGRYYIHYIPPFLVYTNYDVILLSYIIIHIDIYDKIIHNQENKSPNNTIQLAISLHKELQLFISSISLLGGCLFLVLCHGTNVISRFNIIFYVIV